MGMFKKGTVTPSAPNPVSSNDAPWMKIAIGELGQTEIVGSRDNPRIVEYHQYTSLHASDDETAWCSSFANYCMAKAGITGTKSAAALSWKTWGKPVAKSDLRYGDVIVFDHGGGHGHVTFFHHDAGDGLITCLGGNQSNAVRYSNYSLSKVAAIRRP